VANIIALYDSCVLYPAPLRDLLMHLALTGLFCAKWTDAIHDEWIRNVLTNRPDLTQAQLQRTRELMDAHTLDCLITDHEKLIPTLSLPDPNDKHVLAAAIKGSASIIVTYNLKDFPKNILNKFNIEAQHPDIFIAHLIDLAPELVCSAIKRLRSNLKNPPMGSETYLTILRQQALLQTVDRLYKYITYI